MRLAKREGPASADRRPRAQGLPSFRMLLNTTYSSPQAWLLLAQDRGYFEQEGVALELTTGEGAYAVASRMAAQTFDLGYGDINALVETVADGTGSPPVGVFMMFQASPSAIAVKRDGPIWSVTDLNDRAILGYAADVALRTFRAFCLRAGLDPARVKWERFEGQMPEQVKLLLASDQFDGVFGYVSTIQAALVAAGADPHQTLRFIRYADYAPELYGSCIMASRRMIEEQPAALAGILRAVERGLRDAFADPEAVLDAVQRRDAGMIRAAEAVRWATTLDLEMGGAAATSGLLGDVDDARLAHAVALLAEGNGLARTPRQDEVFNGHFLSHPQRPAAAARR